MEPVQLERRFSRIPVSEGDDAEELAFQEWFLGVRDQDGWAEIDHRYRTVILAEAGAGKTHEMCTRAKYISGQGRTAFFIRIEDIDNAFEEAFEVGSSESFDRWLGSQDEAWFFLDSVDEARLESPRAFEKALRRFSARIKPAQRRAHVCITSRLYAWRTKSDRDLVQRHLPFESPVEEASNDVVEPTAPASAKDNLEVRVLQPLNEDDIRLFASCRSTPNIDGFVEQLQRLNLTELAGRPFDLGELLDKWSTDRTLGGRRELIEHSITRRLKDIDPNRRERQPLNADQAREGARALAAAVVLTGKAGIRVPDSAPEHPGIDAEAVLADWPPTEVRWLLESAIFDGVTYGSVRFRHRDVRDFLAAEWFRELLRRGQSRHTVESLVFREQYGVAFVSQRLRVVLPWLILDDQAVRERALALHPEIAVEGGDPAQLPLATRRQILVDIVSDIAQHCGPGTAGDNAAIALIAQPDLADEVRELIDRHAHNDDVAFFLGRLAWQENMSECVVPLLDLAVDPKRGEHARIAAARAVMMSGTNAQKTDLWTQLNATDGLSRQLLAELVQGGKADADSVRMLLASVDVLAPHSQFAVTGLTEALHSFIPRLPVNADTSAAAPLPILVSGLKTFLCRPPFIEPTTCFVSEEFAWLLSPALHAIERLVSARVHEAALDDALVIMTIAPAANDRVNDYFGDHKHKLADLVPTWHELNDRLFWANVRKLREGFAGLPPQSVDDYWHLQGPDHYWSFPAARFADVVAWIGAREIEDDRLVALSLAHRMYADAGKPAGWQDQLRGAVNDGTVLAQRLSALLNPMVSDENRDLRKRRLEHQSELKRRRQEEAQRRSAWIEQLKADPEIVRNPPELPPGEVSRDQLLLLQEVRGTGPHSNRVGGSQWQSLEDEFGRDVAHAYRDAATAHWRQYRPRLRSEGGETSSVPVFGLVGLEIEAQEVDEFPTNLSDADVHAALPYIGWELNDFPSWLELMFRHRQHEVVDAVRTEVFWELDNSGPCQPISDILQKLDHAPWLHSAIFETFAAWFRRDEPRNEEALRRSIRILRSGAQQVSELAVLAKSKVAALGSDQHRPYWYATWVDVDPDEAVGSVVNWLGSLDFQMASHSAQVFIAALVGNEAGGDFGPGFGKFKTARHLKSLYVLMHQYIRVEDDVDRSGGKVYTPDLRDHAQDARNRLFHWLAETPGKQAYIALQELADGHPDARYRERMATAARGRAEADGDIEQWTAEQVAEFGSALTSTPATHRQLFDLTVARVIDLKNWLETGDDSPYQTWARAKDEIEMRNLVAGWLNSRWGNASTVAQESELANGQRMDISLQHPNVTFPVPVELKLLRNAGWTGPQLCERLRNQLAGDYLREGTERCGLFLLIWAGTNDSRKWEIGRRRLGVAGLRDALKGYWGDISSTFPNVAAIEVIVIDLTVRERKSRR